MFNNWSSLGNSRSPQRNHILTSPDLKSFASLKREVNQAAGDFPVIKTVAKQRQQMLLACQEYILYFLLEWLSQKPWMSSYLLTIVTDISAWLRHPFTDTLCSEIGKTFSENRKSFYFSQYNFLSTNESWSPSSTPENKQGVGSPGILLEGLSQYYNIEDIIFISHICQFWYII